MMAIVISPRRSIPPTTAPIISPMLIFLGSGSEVFSAAAGRDVTVVVGLLALVVAKPAPAVAVAG